MLGIYITAGYPDYQTSLKALKILDQQKVDLIELGVPFSDPLADGPVIQLAASEALKQGMNLDKIFTLVQEAQLSTTTILFSYYNPLFVYGFEKLIEQCLANKISGVLIPDLPVNEARELSAMFRKANLDLILLAAVTSTDSRLEEIASLSQPWIYLVSRTGVTGSEANHSGFDIKIKEIIKKLKAAGNNKTVALGFGIDSPEKVKETFELGADMAIVGSKAVKVLAEEGLPAFEKFIAALKSAAVTTEKV